MSLTRKPSCSCLSSYFNSKYLISKKFLISASWYLICAFSIVACTRPQEPVTRWVVELPQQKKIQVSKTSLLSKAKNQAAIKSLATDGILGHVIINVRGAGISTPISISYDADKGDGGPPQALPGSFTIEVPSGAGRLIQVLAVYVEPSGTNGEFQYGDVTLDLIPGDQTVPMDLKVIGSGNIKGGRILGRFFDGDGTTPSGPMEIRYQPQEGKPSMIIERSSMIGGWFQAFALEDTSFDYTMGERILLSQVSLNSLPMNSAKLARVDLPDRYMQWSAGSGYQMRGERAIIGFFGPGVPNTHKVCYKQSTYTYAHLFLSDQTTPLTMSLGAANGSGVRLEVDAAVTTCSEADLALALTSVISILPQMIDSWGGVEALAGFKGVFAFPSSVISGSSSPVRVSLDSASASFVSQFEVLPGIANFADSIRVFFRSSNQPKDYEKGGGDSCSQMFQGGFGFRALGEIPLVAGTLSYNKSLPSPPDMTSSSVLAYCPMRAGQSLGLGFFNTSFSSSGGPGIGVSGPPAALRITKNGSPINFVKTYECFDASISVLDASGAHTTSPAAISYTLSVNAGAVLYGSYSDCNSYLNPISNGSIRTLPANTSSEVLWVKSPSNPTTFDFTVNSAGLTPFVFNLPAIGYGTYYARLEWPEGMVKGICYAGRVTYNDIYGSPTVVGADQTVTLTSSNGFSFFSDSACSTATSSVIINSGTSSSMAYARINPAGTIGEFFPETGGGGLQQAIFRRYSGPGNGTATKLALSGPTYPAYRMSCTGPFKWESQNSNSTVVPIGSSGNISFSGSASPLFYSESGCGTQISNLSAVSSDYSGSFWVKFANAGPATVNAAFAGLSTASLNLPVQGVYKFNLLMSNTSPNHGECVHVTIEPRNYPTDSIDSFPYYEQFTLNLNGFPAGSLFKSKIGNECLDPLGGTSIVKPMYSSSGIEFYYLALNSTSAPWSSLGSGYRVSASGYSPGDEVSFVIGVPPSLAAADGSAGNAPVEYSFFIEDIKTRFSGVAAFISEYFTSSWIAGPSVSLSPGTTTNTRMTDAASATQTYNVTGRSASWTADFTTGTLPSNFSLTNSSGGYAINGSGGLAWHSTDTPRWDRNPDPASGHSIRGLLVEGEMQNLLVGLGSTASENFSTWDNGAPYAIVTIDNSVSISDPMGNPSAPMYRITDNNGGNMANVHRATATFTSDIADNTEFVASIFIKQDSSRYAGLQIQSNGGMSAGVVVDLSTGDTKAMTGPYTPQEVLAHGAEKHINGWFRVWVKFNSHIGTHGTVYLFPAFCDTSTATHCTSGEISAVGSVFVFGAQVERGSAMSSYFPTNYNAGTRTVTNLSIASSDLTSFSPNVGAFRLELDHNESAQDKTLFRLTNGSDSISLKGSSYPNNWLDFDVFSSGSHHVASTELPLHQQGGNSIMVSYSQTASQLNLGQNGLGYSNALGFAAPSLSGSTMQIGGDVSGPVTGYMNMSLKKVEYWPYFIGVPGVKSSTRP